MSARSLSRDPPETLKPKEWFTSVRLDMQRRIVTFLLYAYGFLLLSTTLILFLQGFHAWGFNLDHDMLKWLGGATIGEIGGLLFLTFRATFRYEVDCGDRQRGRPAEGFGLPMKFSQAFRWPGRDSGIVVPRHSTKQYHVAQAATVTIHRATMEG